MRGQEPPWPGEAMDPGGGSELYNLTPTVRLWCWARTGAVGRGAKRLIWGSMDLGLNPHAHFLLCDLSTCLYL